MASATFIWAKILTYIEQHHTEALVSTWFDDVDVVELRDNTLVLFTPNPFRKPILETQCIPYITEAMLAVGQQKIQVFLLICGQKIVNGFHGITPIIVFGRIITEKEGKSNWYLSFPRMSF